MSSTSSCELTREDMDIELRNDRRDSNQLLLLMVTIERNYEHIYGGRRLRRFQDTQALDADDLDDEPIVL